MVSLAIKKRGRFLSDIVEPLDRGKYYLELPEELQHYLSRLAKSEYPTLRFLSQLSPYDDEHIDDGRVVDLIEESARFLIEVRNRACPEPPGKVEWLGEENAGSPFGWHGLETWLESLGQFCQLALHIGDETWSVGD